MTAGVAGEVRKFFLFFDFFVLNSDIFGEHSVHIAGKHEHIQFSADGRCWSDMETDASGCNKGEDTRTRKAGESEKGDEV